MQDAVDYFPYSDPTTTAIIYYKAFHSEAYSARLAGWWPAGWLASPLMKSLFMLTVFSDRTVLFPHNNQSEQYFSLFFSPAEQPLVKCPHL